jgi:hypothetical protein
MATHPPEPGSELAGAGTARDADQTPSRSERKIPHVLIVLLVTTYSATYLVAIIFRIRGQPAAEAWTAASGTVGGAAFAVILGVPRRWAYDRVIIVGTVLAVLGVIGAVSLSESLWTRFGWAITCAAIGTFGSLTWRERRLILGTWRLWGS